jgi:hypothetical protein
MPHTPPCEPLPYPPNSQYQDSVPHPPSSSTTLNLTQSPTMLRASDKLQPLSTSNHKSQNKNIYKQITTPHKQTPCPQSYHRRTTPSPLLNHARQCKKINHYQQSKPHKPHPNPTSKPTPPLTTQLHAKQRPILTRELLTTTGYNHTTTPDSTHHPPSPPTHPQPHLSPRSISANTTPLLNSPPPTLQKRHHTSQQIR